MFSEFSAGKTSPIVEVSPVSGGQIQAITKVSPRNTLQDMTQLIQSAVSQLLGSEVGSTSNPFSTRPLIGRDLSGGKDLSRNRQSIFLLHECQCRHESWPAIAFYGPDLTWHGMAWHGMAWHGMAWPG